MCIRRGCFGLRPGLAGGMLPLHRWIYTFAGVTTRHWQVCQRSVREGLMGRGILRAPRNQSPVGRFLRDLAGMTVEGVGEDNLMSIPHLSGYRPPPA